MRVSTATGLYQQRGDSDTQRDLNEVITVLHEVGYDTFDLSLAAVDREDFILRGSDWEQKIGKLGETAAKLGVVFGQSHLPFVPNCSIKYCPNFQKADYLEWFFECMRRAYHASAMLGVPWTVLHPVTFPEYNYEEKATLAENHRLFDDYVDLGIRLGVGTAIENMVPGFIPARRLPAIYCQHYDQLITLVDSYRNPLVGVCWDTGHAHQADLDQGRAIRAVGKRLKVLHINDGIYGVRDDHLLPYMGEVDWDSVTEGLADIGYEGSMNYETGKVSARAFGSLQLDYVRLAYQNACWLRDLFETKQAQRAHT